MSREKTSREIYNEALDGLYKDVTAWLQEEPRLRDDFFEYVHESLESYVTYTSDAKAICAESKNDTYGLSEGLIQIESGDPMPWSALAFYALEQDLYERLMDNGYDINRNVVTTPKDDEEEEEKEAPDA